VNTDKLHCVRENDDNTVVWTRSVHWRYCAGFWIVQAFLTCFGTWRCVCCTAVFLRRGTKSRNCAYMVTHGYVLNVCVQNDAKEGYGILQYKNGERYEGQWRANFANGTRCTVTFSQHM
jgi:hypothetical protein